MTETNVTTLTNTIKTLIEKGDHAADKAEQFYITAGQHIATLREGRTKREWSAILKAKIGIGVSRAYQLMKIGDGGRTLAQTRATQKEADKKHRKNKRRPSRDGQANDGGPADAAENDNRTDEEKTVENLDRTEEENIVRAFMFQLTGALIAFRNCEKLLPMITEMKSPPHPDDWAELILSCGQRAGEFAGLLQQIEAMPHADTLRRKPILSIAA